MTRTPWPPAILHVVRVGRKLYGVWPSHGAGRTQAEAYATRYGGAVVPVLLAHDSLLTEGERQDGAG